MKSSSFDKLNAQIYDEASAWFVEFRTGEVNIVDRKRFNAWLRKSPEHMRVYLELAGIWIAGKLLDPDHRFDALQLTEDALTESNVIPLITDRLEERQLAPTPGAATSSLRARFAVGLVAIAASAVIAIFGAWVYYLRSTYSTGVGEQRWFALEDGSTIELNAHSKVRVHFSADRRSVDLLDGEVLFRVAKDKTRPFIVRSDDAEIRAIGTEFDVNRRLTGTTVTVLEGRVAVQPPLSTLPAPEVTDGRAARLDLSVVQRTDQSSSAHGSGGDGVGKIAGADARLEPLHALQKEAAIHSNRSGEEGSAQPEGSGPVASAREFLLAAGEQAIITSQATVKLKQPDIAAATAWTQRRLVFEGATLAEVADEFNRFNRRQLVIKNPELQDFHITGIFSSTDPGSLIRFLQARPGIVVTEKEEEILITRKLH